MEKYIVGKNTRLYRCEDGSLSEIKAVIIEREDGKYIGYIGGAGTDEYVSEYGDQMSFNEARFHFPGIKEEEYVVL